MCLIALAWKQHRQYPLLVAANRDEFYARPSLPIAGWPDHPDLVAGRDLQAGGTWLGVSKRGRFAALTNFREPAARSPRNAPSRGALSAGFLNSDVPAARWLSGIDPAQYDGFNLLAADETGLWYLGNRMPSASRNENSSNALPKRLPPGLYVLSNHVLDTPWPKTERLRQGLSRQLRERRPGHRELQQLLRDRHSPEDSDLPVTGLSRELERLLGPIFIQSAAYGTCASTTLIAGRQGRITVCETRFSAEGLEGTRLVTIRAPSPWLRGDS